MTKSHKYNNTIQYQILYNTTPGDNTRVALPGVLKSGLSKFERQNGPYIITVNYPNVIYYSARPKPNKKATSNNLCMP